jgi:uncharacterized membrane-anchored protein YhcB (DUF1043 family)
VTTAEYIQLKKELLIQYDKAAMRYNKLAKSYLEKYKHQSERCNELIRQINNLENKLSKELQTTS